MNLDAFIEKLTKLREGMGDMPVLIRSLRDEFELEPAEPTYLHVVENGLLVWREAQNGDLSDIVSLSVEIR